MTDKPLFQPNNLIIMMNQLNDTLFDNGPKPLLHASYPKNQAKNSVCFSTCYAALRQGPHRWNYEPHQLVSERYVCNHVDLNILKEAKRFPRGV